MVIDFHTHAFPDSLAEKAIAALTADIDAKTWHDGRVSSLLASMDRAGIEKAVICAIATKPSQYAPILEGSRSIASERIIPFPSIHPADTGLEEKLETIARARFLGIKLHPYYQEFTLDEERMFPIYETANRLGLIIVCHTGFDIAFPRKRIADPAKTARVMRLFPGLKLVASHLGGWEDWDEVIAHLAGRNIYIETSYSLEVMERKTALEIIERHPSDYILFGTDSPWADQANAVRLVKDLDLGGEAEEKLFHENAERLLGSRR
jgi:predicted TIM-barrel fold metal-dependent hydrolase